MKKLWKSAAAIALSTALMGCGGGKFIDPYRPNSVDVYKTKDVPIRNGCFYQKGKPQYPMFPWKQMQDPDGFDVPAQLLVVFYFDEDGNLRRAPISSDLERQILDALSGSNGARLSSILDGIDQSGLGAFDYTENELGISQRIRELGNSGRLPNPLDITIPWIAEITFVSLDDNYTFDKKMPFAVAVGRPPNSSPFGDQVTHLSSRAIKVTYQSNPGDNKYERIKLRDCVYDYELNMLNDYEIGGTDFQARIIIDPGGGNNGEDDPDPSGPPPF